MPRVGKRAAYLAREAQITQWVGHFAVDVVPDRAVSGIRHRAARVR
jgi:hypothetical protein